MQSTQCSIRDLVYYLRVNIVTIGTVNRIAKQIFKIKEESE